MTDQELFAQASERLGLPFPIDNFYLPLVRPSDARPLADKPFVEPGRLIDRSIVLDFCRSIVSHYRADVLSHEQVRSMGLGAGYGEIDARIYNTIVRSYAPDLIVEVGAGVSTYYARQASDCRIVCIEPYPAEAFVPWCERGGIELWRMPLQEASHKLKFTDRTILFIDSTHVAKITSELHLVFLDLLPKLKPGNLVHFHDIFLPFGCLHAGHNLFAQTVNWYESIVLGIFLTASRDFETVLPQYWMGHDLGLRPVLAKTIPLYGQTYAEGSAYWIRKTRDTNRR